MWKDRERKQTDSGNYVWASFLGEEERRRRNELRTITVIPNNSPLEQLRTLRFCPTRKAFVFLIPYLNYDTSYNGMLFSLSQGWVISQCFKFVLVFKQTVYSAWKKKETESTRPMLLTACQGKYEGCRKMFRFDDITYFRRLKLFPN